MYAGELRLALTLERASFVIDVVTLDDVSFVFVARTGRLAALCNTHKDTSAM